MASNSLEQTHWYTKAKHCKHHVTAWHGIVLELVLSAFYGLNRGKRFVAHEKHFMYAGTFRMQ